MQSLAKSRNIPDECGPLEAEWVSNDASTDFASSITTVVVEDSNALSNIDASDNESAASVEDEQEETDENTKVEHLDEVFMAELDLDVAEDADHCFR
jgi:hypothetical protein